MNCKQVHELLDNYLKGILPEPLLNDIESHLAACTSCQILFLLEDAELETILASDWYAAEPPLSLVTSVMEELPARPRYSMLKLATFILAWSCYMFSWLLGAAVLGYPLGLRTLVNFALKTKASLHLLFSIINSVASALTLLTPGPLGIVMLLGVLGTLVYCLYRLEMEENII